MYIDINIDIDTDTDHDIDIDADTLVRILIINKLAVQAAGQHVYLTG